MFLSKYTPAIKNSNPITIDIIFNTLQNKINNLCWINDNDIIYEENEITIIKNVKTNKIINKNYKTALPSPNGKYIIFTDKSNNLVLHNHITKNEKILLNNEKYYSNIKYIWLSNSKSVILSMKQNDISHILLIDINGQIENILSYKFNIIYLSIKNIKDLILTTYHTDKNDKLIYSIYHVDLKTHKISLLKKFGMFQSLNAIISPNSKYIAVTYDPINEDFDYVNNLGILNVMTKNIVNFTKNFKIDKKEWLTNNHIIFRRNYGPYAQLYLLIIKPKKIYQLTKESFYITEFKIHNKKIVYLGHDSRQKYFIKILDLTNMKMQKNILIDFTKNISFGKQIEIKWNGTYKNMRGLLIFPNNYKYNLRYGLIVNVHGGGPSACINMRASVQIPSSLIWHYWANAHNVIVFIPEFGAIYDNDIITNEMIKKNNLLTNDINNIESGVDYLISKYLIDDNKLIAIGGSAGSTRVNWLPVISQRYKTIISIDGWIQDENYWLNVNKKTNTFINEWGKFNNNNSKYLRESPLQFINKINTPILFIVCNIQKGGADKYNSLLKYHNVLKKKNILTRYIYLEDEGHVIKKKNNIIMVLSEINEWINLVLYKNST